MTLYQTTNGFTKLTKKYFIGKKTEIGTSYFGPCLIKYHKYCVLIKSDNGMVKQYKYGRIISKTVSVKTGKYNNPRLAILS
jgi:hypothetical protein